ncbi:MAG: hypothetical protein AUJ49_01970 [Desulfovibrionaceae bacterium CG1_02_65_16]|nr:MAG: hypothetical protein AUJ49_01970 [Desulfovibrionaceae bacterium CG1_02_65_16]
MTEFPPPDAAARPPVALSRQSSYARAGVEDAVERLFVACGVSFAPGERVLVKPNLVSRGNAGLSCTHPEVTRAVCAYVLDCGATPRVADSPAFGSASRVARACGLDRALAGLGLRVSTLGRPAPLRLGSGGSIGVSRDALDADRVVSVARLKAHGQFRVTASVKNLFGCVCGCRKAFAHMRLGETPGAMEAMILDVFAALPPACGVVDGVVCLHKGGPVRGEPFALGLLGASPAPLALDAALFGLLGQTPASVPLWAAALRRNLAGAAPGGAAFPLEPPAAFDAAGFRVAPGLDPMRFEPLRFVRGRMKSLFDRIG